jgi:hypothetical protein
MQQQQQKYRRQYVTQLRGLTKQGTRNLLYGIGTYCTAATLSRRATGSNDNDLNTRY